MTGQEREPAERVVRVVVRSVAGVVLAALLLWPGDWLVWRLRVAAGGGMGQVTVGRFTVASLKGGKEEYYFEGKGLADCSVSLFQHAGEGTCSALRAHPEVIVRY